MRVRNLDPIIHMLELLYKLEVINHLEIDVSVVVSPTKVIGSLDFEDFTNPMIDVTIYV